jgi:hypothetical protein
MGNCIYGHMYLSILLENKPTCFVCRFILKRDFTNEVEPVLGHFNKSFKLSGW